MVGKTTLSLRMSFLHMRLMIPMMMLHRLFYPAPATASSTAEDLALLSSNNPWRVTCNYLG